VPLAVAGSRQIRRVVAVLSATLVLFVLPGGVQPGLPALVGAVLGTGGVLATFVTFTGLGRRQLRAPIAAEASAGARAEARKGAAQHETALQSAVPYTPNGSYLT
jgi:hypothetical protein